MSVAFLSLSLTLFLGASAATEPDAPSRPNVILIMTDDQGHGDLSLHGNAVLKTPNMDRIGREGVRLTSFHVSPVCSPTRSSLLTGRYNYRTGVVDTYLGRSMMHAEEVTLAETLSSAGYRTGHVGKWHLGDNYPMRPIDQGFQHSLMHKGGGLAQPAGPPGDGYFDPVLWRDGVEIKTKGYCTDIFSDEAVAFIESSQSDARPFFLYLAYNCPHTPLEVPDADVKPYAEPGVIARSLENPQGHPIEGPVDPDVTAKIYGMVAGIDRGLGRILDALRDRKLDERTIVVFLTDNGPQQHRYKSGLRGLKGSTFDGGIKVPCFVRWPGVIEAGTEFEPIAAHIDLAPTLLDACGVTAPKDVMIDGISLWPWLSRKRDLADYPERTLFFQWHRGDAPERFRAFAVRESRYKLVHPSSVNPPSAVAPVAPAARRKAEAAKKKGEAAKKKDEARANAAPTSNPASKKGADPKKAQQPANPNADPGYLLFDMISDPYEQRDLAKERPDDARRLKAKYEAWFDDVTRVRGDYAPPRMRIGHPAQNPVTLTRQDWRGPQAAWEDSSLGYWEVQIEPDGVYEVTLTFPALAEDKATARLDWGGSQWERPVAKGATSVRFDALKLPGGAGRFQAAIVVDGDEGAERRGAHYAELRRKSL